MRSPVGTLVRAATSRRGSETPVPYIGRNVLGGLFGRAPAGMEAQLRAMGAVGTLFAIVNRTAKAESLAEWRLWRKAKSGLLEDRVEVTSHAALDLWQAPNPFFTTQEFVETFQQHKQLTGEAWWVIRRVAKIPLAMWPVRPDRMEPIPSRERFLAGYVYHGPDGEDVPLELDEVIFLRTPNPLDIYRGMGPVQSILTDIDASRYSAEWNRNFFLNSAEPGGIVQVDKRLSDAEWEEMVQRWREQHQGVANAHRVAILEQGKWVERHYSQRDMQFAELRNLSSEVIREAFGFPKPMLGTSENVNLANAQAGEVMFARWLVRPDLETIKQALNRRLLPMFGRAAEGLEFDYANPVPDDREADDRERLSKAQSAHELVDAGYYAPEVLEAVGLPEISFGQPGADQDRELLIDLVKGAPTLAPLLLPMLGFELPENAAALTAPTEPVPAETDATEEPDDEPEPGEPEAEPEPVPDEEEVEPGQGIADRVIEWLEANFPRPASNSPDHSTGCMLALYPPPELAAQLAVPDGLPPGELHLTVAYCGKADDVDQTALLRAAQQTARRGPIAARISGLARFVGGEDGDVIVALVDSPDLEDLRRDVTDQLAAAGIDYPRDHGYTPHITLIYLDPGADAPEEIEIEPAEVTFAALSVVHGEQRTDLPFSPAQARAHKHRRVLDQDEAPVVLPDITPLKTAHDAAMEQLEQDWQPIQAAQIDSIVGQVAQLVDDGDLAGLPKMTVPTDRAEETLTGALVDIGAKAADQMAAEAAAQDVAIDAVPPADDVIGQIAQATVGLAAADLVSDAAGETMRIAAPGVPGRDVAAQVRDYLEGQTKARLRRPMAGLLKRLKDRLSAALHRGQHEGRVATARKAPSAAYYASEQNDSNTCSMCSEVDGRWLGNTLAKAEAEYPGGHYIRCLGGTRCRGTFVSVYRPEQVKPKPPEEPPEQPAQPEPTPPVGPEPAREPEQPEQQPAPAPAPAEPQEEPQEPEPPEESGGPPSLMDVAGYRDRLVDAVRQVAEDVDLPDGVSVGTVDGTSDGWFLQLIDRNGKQIAVFNRTVRPFSDPPHVYNDLIEVDTEWRGRGIASKVNGAFEDWYRRSGIPEVRTHATSDPSGGLIGAVVWPRAGFDWTPGSTKQEHALKPLQAVLDAATGSGDQDLAAKAAGMIAEVNGSDDLADWPTPAEILNAGYRKGDTSWPGLEAMKNADYYGTKRLAGGPSALVRGGLVAAAAALTRRQILLAQLGRVRDAWAERYGDTDWDAGAEAQQQYFEKAEPILDELAASRAGTAEGSA